jgi:hypothetical protein
VTTSLHHPRRASKPTAAAPATQASAMSARYTFCTSTAPPQ